MLHVSLLNVLIVLLVVSLVWGSWGYGRVAPEGRWIGGWSPMGIVLVILLALYLTGRLG